MSANSRLTLAVHTLSFLAHYRDRQDPFSSERDFFSSERIARSVQTNAVVLRNLLGMMEKQGLVRVQRGSNAGWQVAREPEEITLLDVYRAVEQPELFAMHHTPPNPRCTIGYGIGPALEEIYAKAQNALEEELAHTTIADVLRATLAYSRAAQQQSEEAQAAPHT